MGNKISMCTRPGDQDEPIDGMAVHGYLDGPVGEGMPPPKLSGSTRKASSDMSYHSDVLAQKPALVSGLVHAHHIDSFDAKYDLSTSKVLGQGTCGYVCTVKKRETGDLFALKEISLNSVGGSMSSLRKEIQLQKKLDHPNICKIIESFEDRQNGRMYIVMELCTGGSLVSRMKTHRQGYGEQAAATLVEKMLSAVLYCHHHGVVHRDIKLDNMIYEDEREDAELKLIDFGFARHVRPGSEVMHDQLGTPSYMAPELWTERETPYDSSVDMWAIGVVTYMLLSGQRPFHHQDKKEKTRMIRQDPVRFPDAHWSHLSAEAKDFCTALMKKNPKDRLSASEAVKHPWIQQQSKVHQGDDASIALDKHQEVVESLVNFAEADDLKKLALEVIAFSTPPSKLEELRKLFQSMDTDDSGTLSFEEFKSAMAQHPEISLERLHQLFNKMDVSHNGEVDYTEFLAATVSSQTNMVARASIKSAFTALDRDGDGYITRMDLHSALEGVEEASLEKYLAHADPKGRVSFQAFKTTMMQQLTSPEGKVAEGHLARLSDAAPVSPPVKSGKKPVFDAPVPEE
mmetsp:Transcript_32566/g.85579  ORF Transcript_32566/g.85579 Transcript_32566/m.85579 type:complete len:571 (-) Transcript_32566:452-2164(-)